MNILKILLNSTIISLLASLFLACSGGLDSSKDQEAPLLKVLDPLQTTILTRSKQSLSFTLSDNIKINVDSISVQINAKDFTSVSSFANGVLLIQPSGDFLLEEGTINVHISVKDANGNETIKDFTYSVKPDLQLSVYPQAIPQNATVPASIRFSPMLTTDTAIQFYEWDMDGDGEYEESDIVGNTHTKFYTFPGDYNVSVRVTDAHGEKLVASTLVHIENLVPIINAEVHPSNGQVPLQARYSAIATDNEGIAKYEWDFDGDGNYDYNSTTTATTYFIYEQMGKYVAKIRVTDKTGLSTTQSLPTTTIIASSLALPTVRANASQSNGSAPLENRFSANLSNTHSKRPILWEWDFDGDGTYDYKNEQSPNVNYIYEKAGKYFPKVRVTMDDNLSTTDSAEVNVLNVIKFSRNNDTIDTALSESSDFETILNASTKVSIIIENNSNELIRTLVKLNLRAAGTYSDTWDGLNGDGSKLPEGDYYAVLLYEENGKMKRKDLRDASGGKQYNPRRNDAQRDIAPFDNAPMSITFTLPKASEVTAFIGYSKRSTAEPDIRVATLFTRKAFGKGEHTVKWHSTTNEGISIFPPEGRYFIYGNWAYELSENAIYVKSGAHIISLKAEPPIYDPTSHEQDGTRRTSKISFNLTADASVELTIRDTETGLVVSHRKYENLDAGENIIVWDGKNTAGEFIAPGSFRLGLRAIDSTGHRSLTQYTMQRIYY